MRHSPWLFLAILLLATPAWAKQPRCPLPLDSCLVRFGRMHERPWLGLELQADSLGRPSVVRAVPGGPSARAGIRPGDVLEKVGGLDPQVFFAGKAGWNASMKVAVVVRRGDRDRAIAVPAEHIPEDLFTRMVGEHMLEGHLAYMDTDGTH